MAKNSEFRIPSFLSLTDAAELRAYIAEVVRHEVKKKRIVSVTEYHEHKHDHRPVSPYGVHSCW